MRELAAQHELRIGRQALGNQAALDEPLDRAARPQLDRRRRPRLALAQLRDERLVGQRRDRRLAVRRAAGDGFAQRLADRRRGAVPADLAERARERRVLELRPEQVAHVGDEERRHGLLAVVAGLVPGQVQALLGPRDRRVEQVALGAELVAAAQAQARRDRDLLALGVAEERLRLRDRRKHPLLQPAREQRPHAARAQRERLGDRHASGRGTRPAAHLEPFEQRRELRGRRRQRRVQRDDRRELVERATPCGEHVAVLRVGPGQHLCRAPARRGEQRRELVGELGEQFRRAAPRARRRPGRSR